MARAKVSRIWSRTYTPSAGFLIRARTVKSAESTPEGTSTMSCSTFCSVTTSFLYTSDVLPKWSAPMMSIAAVSLAVSSNGGPGNATVTQGDVSPVHGT